jgi:cell division protein FtsW
MARSATARPVTSIGAWLARPLASFHLVVTISALLTVLGLVMVLSASSVTEYSNKGSAYTMFIKQSMFAAFGMLLFYGAMRVPFRLMRRLALPGMVVSFILLILVLIPGIGIEANGARSWFQVGGVNFQPSELAKIVLAIWGASLLAGGRVQRRSAREMLFPLVPVAIAMFALVLKQNDFGTLITMLIIVLGLLWFAGLPMGFFVVGLVASVAMIPVMILTAGYRSTRITSFLNQGEDLLGANYQAMQAKFSLADGGIWGVGLGQSRAKWDYLPNAHNDFIFAIIGEELGFIGCMAVLGLFGLFAYTGLRIATRSVDPFLRILTATLTLWVLAQAFINVGYVVGLLPVTGLQLPLISSGGTSTAMTLGVFGLIANAARHEPEAVVALHTGPDSRFGRLLRLPTPEPYVPGRDFVKGKAAGPRKVHRVAEPEPDYEEERPAPRRPAPATALTRGRDEERPRRGAATVRQEAPRTAAVSKKRRPEPCPAPVPSRRSAASGQRGATPDRAERPRRERDAREPVRREATTRKPVEVERPQARRRSTEPPAGQPQRRRFFHRGEPPAARDGQSRGAGDRTGNGAGKDEYRTGQRGAQPRRESPGRRDNGDQRGRGAQW